MSSVNSWCAAQENDRINCTFLAFIVCFSGAKYKLRKQYFFFIDCDLLMLLMETDWSSDWIKLIIWTRT